MPTHSFEAKKLISHLILSSMNDFKGSATIDQANCLQWLRPTSMTAAHLQRIKTGSLISSLMFRNGRVIKGLDRKGVFILLTFYRIKTSFSPQVYGIIMKILSNFTLVLFVRCLSQFLKR